MKRDAVLNAAKKAVRARGAAYGPVDDVFTQIALRWSLHLTARFGVRIGIEAADVAAMMADVKLARLGQDIAHADSWVDLAGYAALGGEVGTR